MPRARNSPRRVRLIVSRSHAHGPLSVASHTANGILTVLEPHLKTPTPERNAHQQQSRN